MENNSESTTLIFVISFLIPIVGIVLWLVWNDSQPAKSKAAGKGAVWGIGVGVVLGVIYFMMMMSMINSMGY